MNTPRVTIIMATYNRAHLIKETLDSIKSQTYENWECLIIDDGSTDITEDVVQKYLKLDERFLYFKRPKEHQKGLPGCRNYGISLSKGSYLIFFDDDDIIHPNNISTCIDCFNRHNTDFCTYLKKPFKNKKDISFDFGTPQCDKIPRKHLAQNFITGKFPISSCMVMWKKQLLSNNQFIEKLLYAEEWECYSRIFIEAPVGMQIQKTLYFARKHSKSNTGEFHSKNPVRIQSKIDAACAIITNLNNHILLDYNLAKYFVALSKRLQAPHIFDHLCSQPNISDHTLKKIKKRYAYYKLYMMGYRLKNKFSS